MPGEEFFARKILTRPDTLKFFRIVFANEFADLIVEVNLFLRKIEIHDGSSLCA